MSNRRSDYRLSVHDLDNDGPCQYRGDEQIHQTRWSHLSHRSHHRAYDYSADQGTGIVAARVGDPLQDRSP